MWSFGVLCGLSTVIPQVRAFEAVKQMCWACRLWRWWAHDQPLMGLGKIINTIASFGPPVLSRHFDGHPFEAVTSVLDAVSFLTSGRAVVVHDLGSWET